MKYVGRTTREGEAERTGKEAVVVCFKIASQNCFKAQKLQ
jgi:hypothetical protein